MNKRQVVVLWIVAALLTLGAFIARSGKSKGFESGTDRTRGQTVLASLSAEDVAGMQVSSGAKTTSLVRKDGQWTVAERDGYPADGPAIRDFLRTLAELKVTDGIKAEPSFAPRFGMDPGASDEDEHGIGVILTNESGAEIAHVTLGKTLLSASGMDPMAMMMGGGGSSGRFIRNEADPSGVYKVSEMFSGFSADPKRWLNSDFLKIEGIKSISVSPQAQPDKVDWKLVRESAAGDFELDSAQEGESLDTTAANSLKSLLSYARFDDVVPDETVGEIARPLEKRTVKIETFDGFNYTLTITAAAPETEEIDEEEGPPEPEYLITVDVDATLAAAREKEEDEEDSAAKDTAFAEKKAALEKQLAFEKTLSGRTFKITKYAVEGLLKDRAEIVTKVPAEDAAAPPIQSIPRSAIEAVTPPIEIPGLGE